MASEQQINLNNAYMIYHENEERYGFYYKTSDGNVRGLRFPTIKLAIEGWSMNSSGHIAVEFEAESGENYMKLRLNSSDYICKDCTTVDYINKLCNYSGGRQGDIVVKFSINNDEVEVSLDSIQDTGGYLKVNVNNFSLNLDNSECELRISNLRLYDYSGLRESNEGQEYTRYFEVKSGNIGTCPPSIPTFSYGSLDTTFYSEGKISWGGFTTSVSNSTSTCRAKINGETVSLGQQKTVYNSTGTYRYLVID